MADLLDDFKSFNFKLDRKTLIIRYIIGVIIFAAIAIAFRLFYKENYISNVNILGDFMLFYPILYAFLLALIFLYFIINYPDKDKKPSFFFFAKGFGTIFVICLFILSFYNLFRLIIIMVIWGTNVEPQLTFIQNNDWLDATLMGVDVLLLSYIFRPRGIFNPEKDENKIKN